jgi:hypothetical protein
MNLRITILICFLYSFHNYAQDLGLDVGVELNSGVSTKSVLPFWATANQYGAIPNSAYGSLNAYAGHAFRNPTKNWDFEYKGSFTGYLAKESLIFVNELYGSVRFKGLVLTIGNQYDKIKWQGLSSSNGDFVKSINAREMPGINLSTNGYVTVGIWKNWFKVRANYAEYAMNDDRIVEGAYAHNVSLHFNFKTSENFNFSVGLDDWAQWGGTSPTYGKQPDGWKDYIRMVLGGSGGDGASEGDQINALGNHMGNYLIELNHTGEKLNWSIYWSHPFEDRSGREMMNWPDALYGLYFDFKKTNSIVNYLVTEITYTKNVSGSDPHYTDEDGNAIPASGRDQYFKNYIYASGWSYYGRTIGTPYIVTEVDENGIATGPDLSYNRFIAFNIGTKGFLQKVPYSLMMSYIHYYPWFGEEFETTPIQFSGFAEFDISPLFKLPVNIEVGTSFDIGNKLPNNLGGFLKISKNWNF